MKILFTICGRAGSKGIKGKNFRDFQGVPLVLYTLAAIKLFLEESPEITGDVVVNTDSEDLMDIVSRSGYKNVEMIHRSEALSGDTASKFDVIKNCLETMVSRKGGDYDYVMDLDITSPLRTVSDIRNALNEMQKDDYDVLFSVTHARRNPYFNMVIKVDGYYKQVIESAFTARQQTPDVYDMNASIYIYKPEFVKNGTAIFRGRCGIVVMEDQGVIDLDRERDFELMEVIAVYLCKTNPEFKKVFDTAHSL